MGLLSYNEGMVPRDKWIKSDQRNFRVKKKRIYDALHGSTGILNGVTEKNKQDIFYMLMFCLCVPQSKAVKAEEAIDMLRGKGFYLNDISQANVLGILKGRVRFHTTKTARLIAAKKQFFSKATPTASVQDVTFWTGLKQHYYRYNVANANGDAADLDQALLDARKWLMKNVNGMGMKLASHFLRNIGMPGLAILDVHVIKGMQQRGLITEDDVKPLNTSQYAAVSKIMKDYAGQVGISIDELDMLLWSQRTGIVFK